MRRSEGDVLLSLAGDMIDGGQSSVNREALGMIRGGLVSRVGGLAELPWEPALRRAGIPMAAALLALNLGVLAFWLGFDGLAWPGWGWIIAVAAPSLALGGLIFGRRVPLALGAVLICLIGVAQGNGPLLTGRLQGSMYWTASGFDFPLLACAIPIGLLLLAASLSRSRRAPVTTMLSTSAWVAAGAIAVRLLYPNYLAIGDVTVDGAGICLLAYGTATTIAMAAGIWRRHRDPAGTLAGVLAFATFLPLVLFYGVARVPLGDSMLLLLLTLSVPFAGAVLIRIARFTPR